METTEDEALEVLLISNNPDIAELYRRKLEFDGYFVRIVDRGAAGLRHEKSLMPDIVYLDIEVAGVGPAALADVRSHAGLKAVPVVLLSSESPDQLRRRGFEPGSMEFVVTVPRPVSSTKASRPRSHGAQELARPVLEPTWTWLES